MTEYLSVAHGAIAYVVNGDGPLVLLAHGIGDGRHSFRFFAPLLVAAGYRVAALDIRGCGDSSVRWDGYSRTDIASDLLELVRFLGAPAVIVGQSISGGAATIAAAQGPELIVGIIEIGPFTRAQSVDVPALVRNKRFRSGYFQMAQVMFTGKLKNWLKYLDLAYPTKPADWSSELGRRALPACADAGCACGADLAILS